MRDVTLALGSSYSKRELARIVRASFRNAGKTLAETLRIPATSQQEMLSLIDVEADSFAPAERVLARGKGLIVLTAHVGAWEAGGAYLAMRFGKPIYAIAMKLRSPRLDRIVTGIRRSTGVDVLPQDAGARPVFKALRRGRPVVVLGDIDMPQLDGGFGDFFGRPAWTPTGPAALSRLSGAAIVPMFTTWNGVRHRAHVLPVIEPVKTRATRADSVEITRRWTRAVEDIVRAYPEQWPWFHRRWRTRPEDKPGTPLR